MTESLRDEAHDGSLPLFHGAAGPVFPADFTTALATLGICPGDSCLVHSDIRVFGTLAQSSRTRLLGGLCAALRAAVGDTGTLLMPTFTYSPCRGEVFDPDVSPSTVGVLTEFFRRETGVVRGRHPIFSFAAWGRHAAEMVSSGPDSFGAGSAFEKLELSDAWMVLLGTTMVHSVTYIHRVEQLFGCDYRFLKSFPSVIREQGQERTMDATFFCRHLDRDVVLGYDRLEQALCEAGALRHLDLGNGRIWAVRCGQVLAVATRLLREDPFALLAHPPKRAH